MQTLFFLASFVLLGVSTASAATGARMAYVRGQLISSGMTARQVDEILTDRRLHRYPYKKVAYKKPNWEKTERKLTSEPVLQKGRDYIAAHQAAFDAAERDYGVPKEVIAGVIAIETDFGANTGSYPVFNALYSRMEAWPETTWKGQAGELVALVKFCVASRRDCFAIRGSEAGAMGLVQFMPSSVLAYGVDGNGDGLIDLANPDDAVPSAANFLKGHGWATNQLKALASYYGSSVGYPAIVLKYASLLKQQTPAPAGFYLPII